MTYCDLILKFLKTCDIQEEYYLSTYRSLVSEVENPTLRITEEHGLTLISQVLVDLYKLNSDNVKKCATEIAKDFVSIGRNEKNFLKHYFDYKDKYSLDMLLSTLSIYESKTRIQGELDFSNNGNSFHLFSLLNNFSYDYSEDVKRLFVKNWNIAHSQNDTSKKYDYLYSIYLKLITCLESRELSLYDIFVYNESYIKSELSEKYLKDLEQFCNTKEKGNAKETRRLFCDYYDSILSKMVVDMSNNDQMDSIMNKSTANGTPFFDIEAETQGLVFLNIDQTWFDKFESIDSFMDSVLSVLKSIYRVLKNYRSLAINIENILTKDNRNIKWDLYSYIGIFAEHFIPTKVKKNFYTPEELSIAKLNHLGIETSEQDRKLLKSFFSGKTTKKELQEKYPVNIDEVLMDFENIWYGYTFSDCIIIKGQKSIENSELPFINDNTSLLLIFNKYRLDERKVPCPDCAGLNVSGNSFPEIGLRSWECKNIICPSRSKSNRGKRYSQKTNLMQNGFSQQKDIISKDLIKHWRRDICEVKNKGEIYDMAIRYFSFSGDSILFINTCIDEESEKSQLLTGRVHLNINIENIVKQQTRKKLFFEYFDQGKYISRFIPTTSFEGSIKPAKTLDKSSIILAKGDCKNILSKLPEATFTAAVTSPPYYNARLYSQWPNLYLYLSDMYEIAKQVYRTIKPGGVYLYNIGDICGNEKTVVNSNMGNKRILLGAYTIYIFKQVGFELIENIIWDKGEPQSNRQKNDGKFTPFYQKPMNVYEHMFIFKKPGVKVILNKDLKKVLPENWKTNIVQLQPVIKINSKGENTLGHTAPFPIDIPNFVANVFTEKKEDIILEPFAGSGTTLFSAFNNNRRCLGIELCDEYIKLIQKKCIELNIPLCIK